MPLTAGTRLGPYEIVALVGAGGMGEVYRARDTRLGRDVAIKVTNDQFSERFDREARAVAALNHPNICHLYDVGPNYLVMEYIDGDPLAGPLPVNVALRHAVEIADALSFAHAKGITHRDLKPANILLTASGIKLLDFGLALMSRNDTGEQKAESPTIAITQAGAILGTAPYMSPEQAEGKPVDARSDIFSFGLVLYEMLSGRRAFPGDSAIAIMAAIVRDQPEPLQAASALQNIVALCLRKSPDHRFQSISEVKDALVAATGVITSPEPVLPGASTAILTPDSSAERMPSIAVLPFANIGGEKDNEYFSDGLGEDIINLLSRNPGLKVIARTSAYAFRGKDLDIRTIARTLDVETVLEGSVRRAANRIRVTAQLISAENGAQLWSERFDRELADVFALQDEIAGAIATALSAKFTGQPEAARRYTPKVGAYEAVLRARYHLNKVTPESMARATACLKEAIAIDPAYALPHSVLGGCLVSPAVYGMIPAHEAMPRARAAYQRALAIDPMLPDALVGMSAVCMFYDYDWNEAGRLLEIARIRGPLSGGASVRYGHYLFFTGQMTAALHEHESAVQGDPLNLQLRSLLAVALMAAGRYADAAAECRYILEMDQSFHLAHSYLSQAYVQLGEIERSVAAAEKAYSLAPWARAGAGHLAGLLRRTGDAGRAESVLGTLGDRKAAAASVGFVYYHLVCSEIDEAASWTEKAIDQREPLAVFLALLPVAKELRQSSHWTQLAKKMNLPLVVRG